MASKQRAGRHRALAELTEGLGLDRAYVTSTAGVLPATKFAVDAYVRFVRERSVLEAIASSLTELFSPKIISERVEGMLAGYDFVTRDTLDYFNPRLSQAPQRRRFCARLREARSADAGAAGGGARRPHFQMRRAVVATRCDSIGLCRTRPRSARRLRRGATGARGEAARASCRGGERPRLPRT